MKRPLLEQEWAKALALALVRYESAPIFEQLCDDWGHNPISVQTQAELAGA
jgi:hypothetical protein